jgi:hypothetical protein
MGRLAGMSQLTLSLPNKELTTSPFGTTSRQQYQFGALSPDLYIPIRNTLVQCREFQSYQALRAVFVTEHLFPFRIGLPSADTTEELVDLCLEHLLDKRLTDGQSVLLIFLATLRDRYQLDDHLHRDLEELHTAVQAALAQQNPQLTSKPRRRQILFERLLQLGFRPQVRMVKQVIEEHRAAAFLIHGPPESGQRMLAYRLTRLKPEWETGQHIIIDVGSSGIGKSSRALWGQVAKKLQLPSQTTPVELASKVGKWLTTQDVIFTFDTVDYMPPSLLSAWIDEFWKPLATMADPTLAYTSRRTHLLLFLVDYSGHIQHSDLILARKSQELDDAQIPLLLPPIEPFSELELEIWIDAAAEVLPPGLSAKTLTSAPYSGIPELIYGKISEHCGFSWEGEIAR